MMVKRLSLLLLIIIFINTGYAAVKASVSNKVIDYGQSLSLTIRKNKASDKVDLAPLRALFEIYNTGQSSSVSIINGKTTSTYLTQVTLFPKKTGTLTIPKLSVGTEKTQPITISVNKVLSKPQIHSRALSLAMGTDLKSLYSGQPVLISLKVYNADKIASGRVLPPSISGATIKQIGKQLSYTVKHGNTVIPVAEQHYLLSLANTGKVTIPGFVLEGTTAVSGNEFQSFSSMMSTRPVRLTANNLTVEVKPLPKQAQENHLMVAEQLQLTSDWQAKHLVAGQPFSETLTLTAQNAVVNTLHSVDLPSVDHTNIFPGKISTSTHIIDGKLQTIQKQTIVFIPTKAGKITIPPVSMQWWNSKSVKIEQLQISGKTVEVQPAKQSVTNNTNTVTAQATTDENSGNYWRYLALLLLILWLLTLVILFWVVLKKNPVQLNSNRALKALRQAVIAHDAKAIQTALISWGQLQYNKKLKTLAELEMYITNQQLKLLLQALEHAVYKQHSFQQGQELLVLLKKTQSKKTSVQEQKPVTTLYPD